MKENLPNYYIKKIPGNGLCILRAFKENFEATMNQDISLEDLKENLRKKKCALNITENFCQVPKSNQSGKIL